MAHKQTWCKYVYNNLIINIVRRILLSLTLLTNCMKSYCYCFFYKRVSGFDNWITPFCLYLARSDSKNTTLLENAITFETDVVLNILPYVQRNLSGRPTMREV